MPRRVCNYDSRFSLFHLLSNWGALVSVCGAFFFMYLIWESLVNGGRLVGVWGRNSIFSGFIKVFPVPYHCGYLNLPGYWGHQRGGEVV